MATNNITILTDNIVIDLSRFRVYNFEGKSYIGCGNNITREKNLEIWKTSSHDAKKELISEFFRPLFDLPVAYLPNSNLKIENKAAYYHNQRLYHYDDNSTMDYVCFTTGRKGVDEFVAAIYNITAIKRYCINHSLTVENKTTSTVGAATNNSEKEKPQEKKIIRPPPKADPRSTHHLKRITIMKFVELEEPQRTGHLLSVQKKIEYEDHCDEFMFLEMYIQQCQTRPLDECNIGAFGDYLKSRANSKEPSLYRSQIDKLIDLYGYIQRCGHSTHDEVRFCEILCDIFERLSFV